MVEGFGGEFSYEFLYGRLGDSSKKISEKTPVLRNCEVIDFCSPRNCFCRAETSSGAGHRERHCLPCSRIIQTVKEPHQEENVAATLKDEFCLAQQLGPPQIKCPENTPKSLCDEDTRRLPSLLSLEPAWKRRCVRGPSQEYSGGESGERLHLELSGETWRVSGRLHPSQL